MGGGPNGAAIGPDGKCYVCNNGGFKWISAMAASIRATTDDLAAAAFSAWSEQRQVRNGLRFLRRS
jgi:gluconolactonase